jgi:sugar O-acyltransferase (sialic acid O-acetyltransferase NeuD family)
MSKKLVIFGTGKIAEVISYYAIEHCGLDLAGFTVDSAFRINETFHDLPIVSFEEVESIYPPTEFDLFVALGYHDLNRLRELRCSEAIRKGYRLISIISPEVKLPSNVLIGWNCFIMPPALLHPYVQIGNNVFVFSGALVAHHSIIEDNCWLTSCCNISGNVHLGANSFVAINATIGHSVRIGKSCFLGANSLVTKELQEESVVISESSKPIRLNSSQFLKMSKFTSL